MKYLPKPAIFLRLYCLLLGSAVTLSVSASETGAPSISWPLDIDQAVIEKKLASLRNELGLDAEDGFVHVAQHNHIRIEADQVTQTVQQIYYYGSSDVVQNYGTDTVYWDSSREHLRFKGAHTYSVTGSIQSFAPATARVTDDNASDVFTDGKDVVLQLPGLAAGSFSILEYERVLPDTEPFFFFGFLTGNNEVAHTTLKVDWPDDRKPNWHIDPGYLECEERDNSLTCVADDLPAGNTDRDVYYHDVLPHWSVAAQQSWQDVIDKALADIEWATRSTDGIEPIVDELRQLEPIEAQAQAQHFAAQKIRYVSFSEGEHSHRPHKISDTLQNRYGDCKDKSVLLLELLRQLGYDAYPVLVATNQEQSGRLSLPSNGHFDHMVVCLKEPNGKERCIDPTVSNASAAVTPSWIQNKVRLNLLPGATPTALPTSQTRWQIDVTTTIEFDDQGGQVELTERRYLNEYAASLRSILSNKKKVQRSEWLRTQYQETISDSVEPEFSISNRTELDKPLIIKSNTTFKSSADIGDDLAYAEAAYWVRKLVRSVQLGNEHYGAHFDGISAKSDILFKLNQLWFDVEGSAGVQFDSIYGNMTRSFERGEDSIRVITEVTVPERFVSIEDTERFNRFLDLIHEELEFTLYGTTNAGSR